VPSWDKRLWKEVLSGFKTCKVENVTQHNNDNKEDKRVYFSFTHQSKSNQDVDANVKTTLSDGTTDIHNTYINFLMKKYKETQIQPDFALSTAELKNIAGRIQLERIVKCMGINCYVCSINEIDVISVRDILISWNRSVSLDKNRFIQRVTTK